MDDDDDDDIEMPPPDGGALVFLGFIVALLAMATATLDIEWSIVPDAFRGYGATGTPYEAPEPEPRVLLEAHVGDVPPPRVFTGPPGTPCWPTVDRLRLRGLPSTRSEIRGHLVEGLGIRCIAEKDDWASVVLPDGRRGYASARLLTDDAPDVEAHLAEARAKVADDVDGVLTALEEAAVVAWEHSNAWQTIPIAYRRWALEKTRVAAAGTTAEASILTGVSCDDSGPTDAGLYAAYHLFDLGAGRAFDHPDLLLRRGSDLGIWVALRLEGRVLMAAGGGFERIEGPAPCAVQIDVRWKHSMRLRAAVRFALGLGLGEHRIERVED